MEGQGGNSGARANDGDDDVVPMSTPLLASFFVAGDSHAVKVITEPVVSPIKFASKSVRMVTLKQATEEEEQRPLVPVASL